MTQSEREKRKQFMPKGGFAKMEELLTQGNGGVKVIGQRAIAMIVSGKRKDYHGVIELFRELTDQEKKRREGLAKELSKQLEV